ncbi:response regulator transcription factor [uncultured Winogradskyella sp.]|uniref:response regulator n=1 Tax=uncultured Winogradskyella sp. TaxID=395353 RepID=UPI00261F6F7C|nr:response regulator transcription factor [uncultured Winogradskyella sp.]
MKAIKLLLVEDHDSVSLGIQYSLKQEPSYSFDIKATSDANSAFNELKNNDFDIVILDLILKGKIDRGQFTSGDELLSYLSKLEYRPKVIVMSKIDSFDMLDYVVSVLDADAYILKSKTSLQEIIPAIDAVLSGDNFFSDSIKKILRYNENLLDMDIVDRIILKAISNGLKQNEIAEELKIKRYAMTVSAIEKRIKKLKIRFDAHTSPHLIALAIKNGIIS